jgi:hypothetical protein
VAVLEELLGNIFTKIEIELFIFLTLHYFSEGGSFLRRGSVVWARVFYTQSHP